MHHARLHTDSGIRIQPVLFLPFDCVRHRSRMRALTHTRARAIICNYRADYPIARCPSVSFGPDPDRDREKYGAVLPQSVKQIQAILRYEYIGALVPACAVIQFNKVTSHF